MLLRIEDLNLAQKKGQYLEIKVIPPKKPPTSWSLKVSFLVEYTFFSVTVNFGLCYLPNQKRTLLQTKIIFNQHHNQ